MGKITKIVVTVVLANNQGGWVGVAQRAVDIVAVLSLKVSKVGDRPRP